MNPEVDWFFQKESKWQEEYKKLRSIVSSSGLTEELKWGVPCYTFHKSNVVLIHGFKEYCALLFHKGVLLKDENGIYTFKFTVEDIVRSTLVKYIVKKLKNVKT